MDKQTHGAALKAAMARAKADRQVVADATGVEVRTVTNWTSGKTMPTQGQLDLLRDLLGDYAAEGDPVEAALMASGLTEDRRYTVLAAYHKALREQSAELAAQA